MLHCYVPSYGIAKQSSLTVEASGCIVTPGGTTQLLCSGGTFKIASLNLVGAGSYFTPGSIVVDPSVFFNVTLYIAVRTKSLFDVKKVQMAPGVYFTKLILRRFLSVRKYQS